MTPTGASTRDDHFSTMSIIEEDTHDGSIGNNDSVTLEVDTGDAEFVVLTVDDGSQDGIPPQYDIVQRKYSGRLKRYQYYDGESGVQYRSIIDPAVGKQMQIEITNTSGGAATFTASLESRQGDW